MVEHFCLADNLSVQVLTLADHDEPCRMPSKNQKWLSRHASPIHRFRQDMSSDLRDLCERKPSSFFSVQIIYESRWMRIPSGCIYVLNNDDMCSMT